MTIADILQTAPVIPVIVVDDLEHAKPLARALVAGGLPILEVTLRTPVALDAIRAMSEVEGAIVCAGTVTNERDLASAVDAGSRFIVSPGLTKPLGKAAVRDDIPFLPGIANAGDIMRGLDLGLTHFKFFPAMAAGGLPALKVAYGPDVESKFIDGEVAAAAGQNGLAWPAHPAITQIQRSMADALNMAMSGALEP